MKKIFSFLLLGLLLSVGNAWAGDATMTAGTNGSTCTVNEKAGIKVGTSKLGGDMKITVPAGATSLSFYAAAWKGVSGLSLNISGATTVPTSVVLTADDGISNNSPFTLAGQESSFLHTISLQNISAQTTLTLTSSTSKRFVVWGATYSSGAAQPTLAATPTAVDFGSVFQNESVDAKTVVVTCANLTGSVTYSGLSTPFNATGTIASTGDAITISANTATIGEYSQTLTIQSADDNISVDVAVTMNVLDPNAPGTVNNPYTVAQARSAIDAGGDLTNKYVSGIISQVDSYNSTYHSITYWISDDGTTTNQLQVYSGKGLNGADFSAKSDLQVNDEVTVTGTLKKFNTTYEFDLNNELVSFNRPAAAPIINAEDVNISSDATSGEIAYTISNPTEATLAAALTTGDWISNVTVDAENSKVTFTATANTGEERQATITLTYTGAVNKEVTVTQLAHKDYFALVAQYDGKYLAVDGSTFASGTYGAIEVDVVNEKLVTPQTDALSWAITTVQSAASIQSKTTGKYIGWSSSTNLTQSAADYGWDVDDVNSSWTTGSGTIRSIVYRESANGFKAYSIANIGAESYANTYTTAYDFSEGYVRSGITGTWGTICLPSTVEAEDLAGATFYSIAGKVMSGETPVSLVLEEETDGLLAGIPYIFELDAESTKIVAAYQDDEEDASSYHGLVGTFTAISVDAPYYLISGDAVVNAVAGSSLPANRAYIDMAEVPVYSPSATAPVRIIAITNGEYNATNIQNVEGAENAVKFIENGNLYIEKNGVVYSTIGQRVK